MKIDTRLTRDPRYAEAKARLTDLKGQLSATEAERRDLLEGLGSLAGRRISDAITSEAEALIAGEQVTETKRREALTASLEQVSHRARVLREAVTLQSRTVDALAGEVSRAICADLLPTHQANVRAVIAAALSLAECCRVERDLREELQENKVFYTSTLRPMPLRGFFLTDAHGEAQHGQLARFLLEAVEFGFMAESDLPQSLRPFVQPKAKPQEKAATPGPNHDEWCGA